MRGPKKTKKTSILFIPALVMAVFLAVFSPSLSFADFNSCAVDWSLFNSAPGFISAYTYKGQNIRDTEARNGNSDPTHGSANVPPSGTDLASGAASTNPGPDTTPFFGYYDGGTPYDRNNPSTMDDDVIFFRVRVSGDPTHGVAFDSYHWNVLFDTDADGYKEYWIDLEGSWSQNGYDRLNILYDNSNNQDIPNPDAPGVRVDYFTAYNTQDTGSSCQFGLSHTRAYPINDGTGDWYIEEQIPMTAFKDSNGNQVLFPDSPVAFVWSTSASNQDPLQKDWMMDLNWLSNSDPITFGDIVIPDGEPIVRFTDSAMNFTGYYTIGDQPYVYVKDPLANQDGNSIEQIQVTISDPSTGDDEVMTLVETGPDTGIFSNVGTGTVLATVQSDGVFDNSDNDGSLEAASGDTIYVTYTNTNALTVTDNATVGDPCNAFIQFTRANGLPSGEFMLTSSTATSDRLYVTVTNSTANTDAGSPQKIGVTLTGNDSQQMTLAETGNNTGVFRNTTGLPTEIQVDFPAIADDNLWEDNDSGTVTATYSYTCGGQQYTRSATATLFVTGNAGKVSFTNGAGTQTAGIYTPGQPVFVKVADSTACTDPDGTVPVVVTGSSGDSETLHLTQTSPGSGVYMDTVNDLVTTAGSATVTSASSDFVSEGLQPGGTFVIATGPDAGMYTIANVNSATTVTLTKDLTTTATGVSFAARPLMTASSTGSNIANDRILTAEDGDTLTVTYHDCNDGDNVSTNDDKTATAAFNTPPVLINEVLFRPDPATCQTEYIQLYNASTQPVDATGYRVTDGDQFDYTVPQFNGTDITLQPGNRIYISIYDVVPADEFDSASGTYYLFAPEAAHTGIFPSNELGDPDAANSADQADQVSLYNASGVIVDYVAWSNTNTPSVDFLSDFAPAVAAGIWQHGAYVSTLGTSSGQAIRRIADGFDTNTPSDWSFTGTSTVCQTIITRTVISAFDVRKEEGRTVVTWETASETGTAGFNLLRLDRDSGAYVRVNGSLLPALISSPQGGRYRLVDKGASPKGPDTYILDEVEGNGIHRSYGPFIEGEGIGRQTTSPAGDAKLFTFETGDGTTVVTDSPGRRTAAGSAMPSRPAGRILNQVAGFRRTAHALGLPMKARQELPLLARKIVGVSGRGIAKIAVEKDSLYYLRLSDIALLLGTPPDRVTALLASHNLSLTTGGAPVAWMPAKGLTGMYFYGAAIDSPYTKDNIYLLREGRGLRIPTGGGRGGDTSSASKPGYVETVHFEQNVFAATAYFTDPSADYWFWDYVVSGYPGMDAKSFTLHVDGVAPVSSAAFLTIHLQGATETQLANEHHAVFTLNGTVIGESSWQGLKGDTVNLSFSQGLLREGDNTLEVAGVLDAGVPYSIFYVNSFDLSYVRTYQAVGNKLLFSAGAAAPVTVGGFTSREILLFDVTHPRTPRELTGRITRLNDQYRITFTPSAGSSRYLAIAASAADAPSAAWTDAPSQLTSRQNSADYLIITTPELKEAAQRLADYRTNTGLSSMVVLQDDIMNEFNHGVYNPGAIRDFLAYAYHYWHKAPRYVLLAGNGTYDYKDNMGYGDNLLPTIMVGTPDGLSSSDNRFADVTGDHVPRMAVGRLPVHTPQEMEDAVTKIIDYEASTKSLWGKRIILAADYPESDGNFPDESDELASAIPAAYSVQKIYLSEHTPSDAHMLLTGALKSGGALLNYEGHAGVDRLSQYGLLLTSDVSSLDNAPALPIVAAMTCVVGQFDIPGYDTLAEALVLQPGGGAIAAWSPTGMSKNSLANVLDESFVGSFTGGEPVLGDAILKAYSAYARAGNEPFMIDIYSLLGDPALRIR